LRWHRAYSPHILPFAVFAVITILVGAFDFPQGISYPLKTILTAACLVWAWNGFRSEIRFRFSWTAVLAGVFVFACWVGLDGLYPHLGESAFNPYQEAEGATVYVLVAFRLIGAALVVPVMEEVFWRSFALRFVLQSNFKDIPLGKFSWYSFVLIAILFGFEHHRWLAGILAGMVYAFLLYRSKNLFEPILSHAVTNFLLGAYVLYTGEWSYW
jgi:uncharacterized protein